MLDNGEEVDACFFDFSKAFDEVDHRKLVKKLVQSESIAKSQTGLRIFLLSAPRLLS